MNRKEGLIAGLIEARDQILETVSGLSLEQQDEVFLGIWSIKDLLAHLVGWDFANIETVKDIRTGESPRIFQHWTPNWVEYNAELVRRYKLDDFRALIDSARQSHNQLIEFIQEVPTGDIEKDFGAHSPDGSIITIESVLQFEIDDEIRHYQQIQDWLQQTN